MATWKRQPDHTPLPRDGNTRTLPLEVVLDNNRWPKDPEARHEWLQRRKRIAAAAVGGPFDPRQAMLLEGAALRRWLAERLEWAEREGL